MLAGKSVLVTGGANGIGLAIVQGMAAAGARVAVADINGDAAAAAAAQAGTEAMSLAVDVGDVDAIDKMVAATVERYGQLDVIVNNAGVTRQAGIMELTEADWDRMHRVNAKGVFFCLQRAARQMIDQGGGRIINIASIAGRGFAGTSNAAYAASKGAVISLTKTAAQQLGRHNINVNSVCPGATRTEILTGIFERRVEKEGISMEEVVDSVARTIPIRRLNEPEDVAGVAVFLASPAARNITGQAFNVDGGLVPS